MHIDHASPAELASELALLEQRHQQFIERQLRLDLTRGKPSVAQLDLSNALLDKVDPASCTTELRNYGVLDGLPEAKQLFGDLLDIPADERQQRVFVGGNSSLSLMHYAVWFATHLGLHAGATAWQLQAQQQGSAIKMLCPCPGYDRHFKICEQVGIDMLPVPMTGNGPDMDAVEAMVGSDPMIKGIWCVPRFSNPTGETYSDAVVERMAALPKIAGDDFLVFWDNAYAVHPLHDSAKQLKAIDALAQAAGTADAVLQFGSTSKITFAGAGLGFMSSSEAVIKGFTAAFGKASIGSDKLNQWRHVQFLQNRETLEQHMAAHASIIAPKFALLEKMLQEGLAGAGMGEWTQPDGGYFVSFDTLPGLAQRVVALAAETGVKLTPAGATFPNGVDPEDRNIRLAPTFPVIEEVEAATEVFINCVKLASVRQRLNKEPGAAA